MAALSEPISYNKYSVDELMKMRETTLILRRRKSGINAIKLDRKIKNITEIIKKKQDSPKFEYINYNSIDEKSEKPIIIQGRSNTTKLYKRS